MCALLFTEYICPNKVIEIKDVWFAVVASACSVKMQISACIELFVFSTLSFLFICRRYVLLVNFRLNGINCKCMFRVLF